MFSPGLFTKEKEEWRCVFTLNCSLFFTFFWRASVMAWSKVPRIFIAS